MYPGQRIPRSEARSGAGIPLESTTLTRKLTVNGKIDENDIENTSSPVSSTTLSTSTSTSSTTSTRSGN